VLLKTLTAMKNIKYSDFDVEGVVGYGGHSYVIRGCYIPTGKLCALKVYKSSDSSTSAIAKEGESLEKLAETSYIPEPIGFGSTPPHTIEVPVLPEAHLDCSFMSFHSQPFLAKAWVTGDKIFHCIPQLLKETDPQPFKKEGKTIIHQLLDFINKSASKGIYLSDLWDALWIPDERRISLIDIGSRINSLEYVTAHCIELILGEARIELPKIGTVYYHLFNQELGIRDPTSEEVKTFVGNFNEGKYKNRFGTLEKDVLKLLDDVGYPFQPRSAAVLNQ
jgi:hypothetical protein